MRDSGKIKRCVTTPRSWPGSRLSCEASFCWLRRTHSAKSAVWQVAASLLAGIQGGVGIMLSTGDLSHLEAALDVGIESLRRTGFRRSCMGLSHPRCGALQNVSVKEDRAPCRHECRWRPAIL
jgi:hypothetical protein